MNVARLHPPCPTLLAMTEMWRPIPGHPRYQASWDGRIRNATTGHVLKPQQAKSGQSRPAREVLKELAIKHGMPLLPGE